MRNLKDTPASRRGLNPTWAAGCGLLVLLAFVLACGQAKRPSPGVATPQSGMGMPVPTPDQALVAAARASANATVAAASAVPETATPRASRIARATRTPAAVRERPATAQARTAPASAGGSGRSASSAPVGAQSSSRQPPAAGANGGVPPEGLSCPPDAPIKGTRGHVYHTPASRTYETVVPAICFASTSDALQAGYRPAAR